MLDTIRYWFMTKKELIQRYDAILKVNKVLKNILEDKTAQLIALEKKYAK